MKRNSSITGDAHGDLITHQLNLTAATRLHRPRATRKAARARAAFWFAQMRKAVDAAREWRPAPPPRPQQTYIHLQPANLSTLDPQISTH